MSGDGRALSDDDFVALTAFLSGYLHQDFVVEHRTAHNALRAFLADASAAERRALGADCERFLARTKRWPWREVTSALRSLGGAWMPHSRAALEALLTTAAAS